ncbi:MAG: hypothetical protein ACPGC9_00755 [Cytophagales bacterium]
MALAKAQAIQTFAHGWFLQTLHNPTGNQNNLRGHPMPQRGEIIQMKETPLIFLSSACKNSYKNIFIMSKPNETPIGWHPSTWGYIGKLQALLILCFAGSGLAYIFKTEASPTPQEIQTGDDGLLDRSESSTERPLLLPISQPTFLYNEFNALSLPLKIIVVTVVTIVAGIVALGAYKIYQLMPPSSPSHETDSPTHSSSIKRTSLASLDITSVLEQNPYDPSSSKNGDKHQSPPPKPINQTIVSQKSDFKTFISDDDESSDGIEITRQSVKKDDKHPQLTTPETLDLTTVFQASKSDPDTIAMIQQYDKKREDCEALRMRREKRKKHKKTKPPTVLPKIDLPE